MSAAVGTTTMPLRVVIDCRLRSGVAGASMSETRGVGGGPSIPEPVTKDIGKR